MESWIGVALAIVALASSAIDKYNARKIAKDKLDQDAEINGLRKDLEYTQKDLTRSQKSEEDCQQRTTKIEQRLDECMEQHKETQTELESIKAQLATLRG